jgi:hypothetical protein
VISCSCYGRGVHLLDASNYRVRVLDGESAGDAAHRALVRRARGASWSTWREDHWTQDRDGRTISTTYQATLCGRGSGHPGDGSPVLGEVWVTVEDQEVRP